MSEVIRRLVSDEASRSTRRAQIRPFGYLSEKIGQALQTLTLRDDPRTTADAFSIIDRGFASKLPPFPHDELARPDEWAEVIKETITPTDEDLADAEAKDLGGYYVRAARMNREEKYAFSSALWSLHYYLSTYAE